MRMSCKFKLAMSDAVVDGKYFDLLTFEWEEEKTAEEVLAMSSAWIETRNFLTTRMNGLQKVGSSSFTIEPLDE